ncbi:MAG TPA: hypothetical protein VF657_20895 [Actinoplanes sp.]|jgi:hypothetical protein
MTITTGPRTTAPGSLPKIRPALPTTTANHRRAHALAELADFCYAQRRTDSDGEVHVSDPDGRPFACVHHAPQVLACSPCITRKVTR